MYLISFLVISYILYLLMNSTEHLDASSGVYCETCNGRSIGQCMKCYNCGFCAEGGKGTCMRGSFSGPNDDKVTCPRWIQNDPFWSWSSVSKKYINPAFHKKL